MSAQVDQGVLDAPLERVLEVLDRADEVAGELIDALAALGARHEPVDGASARRLVERSRQLTNRHERICHRSVEVLRAAREAGTAHHDDDGQFVGRVTQRDGREGRRLARLGRALGNGRPGREADGDEGTAGAGDDAGAEGPGRAPGGALPGGVVPQRPLAQAADEGRLGDAHTTVILAALAELPLVLSPESFLAIEQDLVRKAQKMTPRALRKEGRRSMATIGIGERAVTHWENGVVEREEERALERASFWMRENDDGTTFGQFVLPTLQASMLGKVLDAMTAPRVLTRRARTPGEAPAASGTGRTPGEAWKERQIDWRHEKGKALAALLEHLPTDGLSSKVNAIVVVHTSLEVLRRELDEVGYTDGGVEVSAGQVRRLAVGAGTIPLVMGGDSIPLDLGRQSRTYTAAQRVVLSARYRECAEESCDRPFAWCEIHHDVPWGPVRGSDGRVLHPGGGFTDLAHAIPLCWQHHRRMDDCRFTHAIDRDGEGTATVRFLPRTDGGAW